MPPITVPLDDKSELHVAGDQQDAGRALQQTAHPTHQAIQPATEQDASKDADSQDKPNIQEAQKIAKPEPNDVARRRVDNRLAPPELEEQAGPTRGDSSLDPPEFSPAVVPEAHEGAGRTAVPETEEVAGRLDGSSGDHGDGPGIFRELDEHARAGSGVRAAAREEVHLAGDHDGLSIHRAEPAVEPEAGESIRARRDRRIATPKPEGDQEPPPHGRLVRGAKIRRPLERQQLELTFPNDCERLVREYCIELNRKQRQYFVRGRRKLYLPRSAVAYIPDPAKNPCTVVVRVKGQFEVIEHADLGFTLNFKYSRSARRFKKRAILFEELVEGENAQEKQLFIPAVSEAFMQRLSSRGSKVADYGFSLWLGNIFVAEKK